LIANMEAPAFGFYQKLGFRPARRNVLMIREF
jgi:ribosomal protein S18 acetylase RimI-like enzyme